MFIPLGEPRERQRFDGLNEIVGTELWFYQGEPGVGLPSFFYLVFFRYASLESTDPLKLLTTLNDISPELGRASLSLDPSGSAECRF